MKGVRFSAEQIIGILKEGESSKNAAELCRRVGITQTTYYRRQKSRSIALSFWATSRTS